MEYRFSLTPRLISLAAFACVALMVLLFALGYQVGVSMAQPEQAAAITAELQRRAAAKAASEATQAAAPVTDRVQAAQKVLP